jgi:hypothetical protein
MSRIDFVPFLLPNSVYRDVHPQIIADLQRQDLLQLRPRRECSHSQRPTPENYLFSRRPPSLMDRSRKVRSWCFVPKPSGSHWLANLPPLCRPNRAARRPDLGPEFQQIVAKVQSAAPPPLAPSDLLAVHVDQVRTECESREAGRVHVGHQFWRRLGIDGILAPAGLSERVRQLACAMTLNRLIHPASELAMPNGFVRRPLRTFCWSIFRLWPKMRSIAIWTGARPACSYRGRLGRARAPFSKRHRNIRVLIERWSRHFATKGWPRSDRSGLEFGFRGPSGKVVGRVGFRRWISAAQRRCLRRLATNAATSSCKNQPKTA